MSETDFAPLKLQNQLCFPLYLCSKELIKKYRPLLDKLDLTYTQYVVMMCLWERGEIKVTDLCKVLLLETNTISPVLQKLERKGYIKHSRAEDDGRSFKIQLTATGHNLREHAIDVPAAMRNCINLSQDEAETLYRLLYKVLLNIEGAE